MKLTGPLKYAIAGFLIEITRVTDFTSEKAKKRIDFDNSCGGSEGVIHSGEEKRRRLHPGEEKRKTHTSVEEKKRRLPRGRRLHLRKKIKYIYIQGRKEKTLTSGGRKKIQKEKYAYIQGKKKCRKRRNGQRNIRKFS